MVAAAHQRPHRPGVRFDRHQRPLGSAGRLTADRRGHTQDLIQACQSGLNRVDGPGLQLGVHGGEDLEPRVVHDVRTVALLQVLQESVQKVAAGGPSAARLAQLQPNLVSLLGLLGSDVADGRHAGQDHLLALLGPLEIAEGIVAGR